MSDVTEAWARQVLAMDEDDESFVAQLQVAVRALLNDAAETRELIDALRCERFAGMLVCPDCGSKRCPRAVDAEDVCAMGGK